MKLRTLDDCPSVSRTVKKMVENHHSDIILVFRKKARPGGGKRRKDDSFSRLLFAKSVGDGIVDTTNGNACFFSINRTRRIMFFGISSGLGAALMASVSYIFSKWFLSRHPNPFFLTVFAQLAQCFFGILLLTGIAGKYSFPLEFSGHGARNLLILLAAALFSSFGNFCFFRTLKEIEASRLSSLLGLKIAMLGVICLCLPWEKDPSPLQWTAILLGTVAAVGMNFTGGRFTLNAGFWLFLTLLGYACGDLSATRLIHAIKGPNGILNSFAAVSWTAVVQGILTLPLLFSKHIPKNRSLLTDSIPYAACWFASLLFLFYCFGTLGVIFGTILQSARGILSVLIGAALVRAGFRNLEPSVGFSAWMRRFVMAVLMVSAMTLYALAK